MDWEATFLQHLSANHAQRLSYVIVHGAGALAMRSSVDVIVRLFLCSSLSTRMDHLLADDS